METLLIKHDGARFEEEVLIPWLQSFSDLVGVVDINSGISSKISTLRYEFRRTGAGGVADSIFYRLFYALFLDQKEREKIDDLFRETANRYDSRSKPDRYITTDPNDTDTKRYIESRDPDLVIARCKVLLDRDIFDIPPYGTFVLHPGICPEYRNSHGCFWALANNELDKVGYTLLKIDEGIDTGPIYHQAGTDFDPIEDEHVYIQYKVITDNLDAIRETLERIVDGEVEEVDISGRRSAVWGQPKLSAWIQWKRRERRFE